MCGNCQHVCDYWCNGVSAVKTEMEKSSVKCILVYNLNSFPNEN